ncbi:MAG: sulfate ABC transporter permease subunit CysT, partial [bacterium]|nr:sulfate ABC transporter permease subunit CysT [bacterium]
MMKKRRFRSHSILPGFGITMGITFTYLSLLLLIPLSMLYIKAAELSWAEFQAILFSSRAMAAFRLSFGAAFLASALNTVFGLLIAWVLVRYTFPGK